MRAAHLVVALSLVAGGWQLRADEALWADYLRGFDEGYRGSYAAAYVTAYNQGLWNGRDEGYAAGFDPTYAALYSQAFDRAHAIGFEHAYQAAFDAGQRQGAAALEASRSGSGSSAGSDFSVWIGGGPGGVVSGYIPGGQPAPFDLGLSQGIALGRDQGRQTGYDNGYGVHYGRALEVGRSDATLLAPLDGAHAGLGQGQTSGIENGWREGFLSAYGRDALPSDALGRIPRIDLPALDEERFLADVLGGDTLAAIRSGQVQGLASIYVEELADFQGVIDVPVVTHFPALGPATEPTPWGHYVPPSRADEVIIGSPVSSGDATAVLEAVDEPAAPAQVHLADDVALSPLSVAEPVAARLNVAEVLDIPEVLNIPETAALGAISEPTLAIYDVPLPPAHDALSPLSVPEPATALLAVFGAAALAWAALRSRR